LGREGKRERGKEVEREVDEGGRGSKEKNPTRTNFVRRACIFLHNLQKPKRINKSPGDIEKLQRKLRTH